MTSQPSTPAIWRSWLLLVISGSGGLFAIVGAGLLVVAGSISLLKATIPGLQSVTLFNLAWVMLLVGLLCIPAVVYSLLSIRGKNFISRPNPKTFLFASAGLLVWGLLVLLFKPVETSQLAWLLLPPLVLLVTVLPLWWYIETGRRGLTLSSPAQSWGMIGFSLVFTLPVILTLELLVLGLVLVFGGIYLSSSPDFAGQLAILQQMVSDPNFDPQILMDMFSGLLQRPGVILALLAVVSGVVPLLEEMFKPLAVWLLAGDKLTPAQGFLAGMLSGASFALWENLTALSASGDGSGTLILVARVGTGLLHIVTAGMVSWGMASFWQSRRYLGRMVGAYVLAVMLHGLWNASGVLTGIGPLLQIPVDTSPITQAVESGAVVVLIALVFVNLGLLLFFNARLRRAQPVEGADAALLVSDLQQTNPLSPDFSGALPEEDADSSTGSDSGNE
ncbi:MAG: PrsW family glutamic-type intramembrane protease [Bellilinea sp.]